MRMRRKRKKEKEKGRVLGRRKKQEQERERECGAKKGKREEGWVENFEIRGRRVILRGVGAFANVTFINDCFI